MPRIDPLQLLNCLTVLLTPSGGILSKNEVQRLASLMTKFSKKLVSKCVYILILKNTETSLLGQFMHDGGWNLVQVWLQDGINNKNWALVKEILELLLMSPTDVEQLKSNNLPKLVKSLTKREDATQIIELAESLVDNWLKIVKQNNVQLQVPAVVEQPRNETALPANGTAGDGEPAANDGESCYKINVRDGKVIMCKVQKTAAETPPPASTDAVTENGVERSAVEDENKIKNEKSNHDRYKSKSGSGSSSSSSSSKSSKTSRDREKDRSKLSSSSSSSRNKDRDRDRDKSSSSSRSRDKDRNSRSDKDKHRSNGSIKISSSSKSSGKDKDKDRKESKEKQAEKDKDTLSKIQPQTLQKLGRIPKKGGNETKKDDAKKSSFSIEVRKNTEEKPKTVKVFNSKMRSTGLLEETKPPPPRAAKKTPTSPLVNLPATKRPSPQREPIPPPEKRQKVDNAEKAGIKLILPKPKPGFLQESDIFMDALTASATAKKEPKKRKRRISVSKDASSSPPHSPQTPTTPTTAAATSSLITPANFYQDTLEAAANDDERPETAKDDRQEEDENPSTPTDVDPESKMEIDEKPLKGVLVHGKRKGPKRSIRWKADDELVEVQYFELDETERINVYKTFGEMSKMELSSERQALQMSRNRPIPPDDNMEAKIPWRYPSTIDLPPPLTLPGSKSLEKDIQFAREKATVSLPPFLRMADSPSEPDPEVHPMTDPVQIPLDDPENVDTSDAPPQAWPEPKGSPPHVPNIPQIFQNVQQQFQGFAPHQNQPFQGGGQPFPNAAGFIPPNLGLNLGLPNNGPMMQNMPPPPDIMGQPPNMFHKPDNFNQNEFQHPPPFAQQNVMFQNNFNMRGRGGFRRGMGNGPWMRMNGPPPGPAGVWNQRGGGGGGMGRGAPPGRLCKNIRNHGYCRNRDNCAFFHPN